MSLRCVNDFIQNMHSPKLQAVLDCKGHPIELGWGAHGMVFLGQLAGVEVAVKVTAEISIAS